MFKFKSNHAIYIQSVSRVKRPDGRNIQGLKSDRFANWRVSIQAIINEDVSVSLVDVDDDHLIIAVLRAFWRYREVKKRIDE